ncbi:MAG: dihydropyrimidinase [Verrucomicrobiota bacterium]|jgi:dihydropyrimidinase|nr:dihydropyrimidinase [Verrucomicrobiota bacterium]
MKTLIQHGFIITAGESYYADLRIDDGTITLIGKDLPAGSADEIIDASGLYIMPGGIDPHTHLEMPFGGTVSSDDFFTGQRAAAFGGTTFHIDFSLQSKGNTLLNGIKTWKQKAADKACIDYGFHIAVTDPSDKTIEEIPLLLEEGVSSLKLFMAYKNVYQVDDTGFLKVMDKAKSQGMLTLVHAENGDAISYLTERLMSEGKTGMKYHSIAHSAAVESEATNRAVSFCDVTGAPLYIVHISAEGAVKALREGRRKGLPVMGETCTQYMFCTEDDIARGGFEGAKYICSPPPKTETDKAAVWEAVCDGTLQTIATDHCPFWFEGGKNGRPAGKELGKGNWSKVPNGMPGIEDRFPVVWHHGVNSGKISPERFVEIISTNPARIFGLYPQKGSISIGADADLVLFDPNQKHVISAGTHHMNVDYNIYEEMEVTGWPKRVMVRGRTLVMDDVWLGEAGYGKFVERNAGTVI